MIIDPNDAVLTGHKKQSSAWIQVFCIEKMRNIAALSIYKQPFKTKFLALSKRYDYKNRKHNIYSTFIGDTISVQQQLNYKNR